ncbi:DNA polymerase IV [Dehalobacterium formicoaceticum]|uniref:DNA polymerase IV n=1 Tax=Dehalobacterium formicoaceticum TaxID=51515 RepID=A0ABT1Y2V2_9FIRM|nr:DNA polymerase IV [Dehalobacterium formicoaceticum]
MQPVIFLVDMNAFFISCEMTRNPELKGKPAAVAGNPKKRTGIILAANYEARAQGVKTAMVLHEALRLCPGMLLVPPDHHFYEEKSHQVMDLLAHYSPLIEQNSIDEAWLDMTGTEGLFGKPEDAAEKILSEIKEQLGLWCSVGIATNKFLAKMASEIKKPLGITTLWPNEIESKLWPLPVRSMYGVGKKTAEKLNHMGIHTIGDLAKLDPDRLVKNLGKAGREHHQHANGLDFSPLTPRTSGDMKSIGRSKTLPQDLADLNQAKIILLELTERVGITARKYEKKGNTVQITLKYSDFKIITRQMTIPRTNATLEIYHAGCTLLEENWQAKKPIRLLGISIGGFNPEENPEQMSLFDFAPKPVTGEHNVHNERIDQVMDKIRAKHGMEKIHRGTIQILHAKTGQDKNPDR